ncbi:MAG: heme o synthase, partial [Candidatus Hodarchaeales archaeon]
MKLLSTLQIYLALTKPRVLSLLVLSAATAFISGEAVLSANAIRWDKLSLVIIAGFLTSGGSCTINSWFERDIDSLMPRTKQRPLPMGLIEPWKALIFGISAIFFGVILAYFFLNALSALLMLIGAIWYSVGYTMLLKRRTRWNILWGGPAGVFPILSGWAAAYESLDVIFPWILGLLVWIWIPLHFWTLAIRFREEYAAVSIPMLPVVIGPERTMAYIGFSALFLSIFALAAALMRETHFVYILGIIPLGLWMLRHTW